MKMKFKKSYVVTVECDVPDCINDPNRQITNTLEATERYLRIMVDNPKVKVEAAAVNFTEDELRDYLRGIFHCDTTRLEHHQENRFGELPPAPATRWYEPRELALQIARRKFGSADFLHEPIPGVRRKAEPVRFNEAECGGVFDGNMVHSDADSGL